ELEPAPEPSPAPEPEAEPTPEPEAELTPEPSGKPGKKTRWRGNGRRKRTRVKVYVARVSALRSPKVTLRGRLAGLGNARRVAIQRWSGRWRTVSRSHVTRDGTFGKRLRLRSGGPVRVARLRVVAPAAVPSRPIRVRLAS
ncbi:MAG TPA: hypothetical protein VFC52_01480, partial [Solirubrobacterales bacterium]|nr:hypothetical protein [Solirubrobacterales bacterium]